jgi:hypothetical protein
MTNMPQPWDPEFDQLFSQWACIMAEASHVNWQFAPAHTAPLMLWRHCHAQDVVWYWALDDYDAEDFAIAHEWAVKLGIQAQWQVTTALALTCAVDPELTHDIAIPGIWLTRRII